MNEDKLMLVRKVDILGLVSDLKEAGASPEIFSGIKEKLNQPDPFSQAIGLMREYRDAQMECADQAGPEDMGDVKFSSIMRRASAGAAICKFIRNFDTSEF